jgi:hypothetical protein
MNPFVQIPSIFNPQHVIKFVDLSPGYPFAACIMSQFCKPF